MTDAKTTKKIFRANLLLSVAYMMPRQLWYDLWLWSWISVGSDQNPTAVTIIMSALKDVVSLYQLLKSEWAKKPPNLEKCGELLTKLKVCWMFKLYPEWSVTDLCCFEMKDNFFHYQADRIWYLQVGLTSLMFLPTSNATAPQQELLIASKAC